MRKVSMHTLLAALAALTLLLPAAAGAFMEQPEDVIEGDCGSGGGKYILIAYDTKHGATATVAEYMARILCKSGHTVDFQLTRNVESVDAYDAVLVGSPVYNAKWLPGAKWFLFRFGSELADKYLGLFVTCTYVRDEKMQEDPEGRMQHAYELYVESVAQRLVRGELLDWGIFAGEYTYDELYPRERRRMERFASIFGTDGDYRNWDKIKQWTINFSNQLKQLP